MNGYSWKSLQEMLNKEQMIQFYRCSRLRLHVNHSMQGNELLVWGLFLCLSSSDLFWMAQNVCRQRQEKSHHHHHHHHLGNYSLHIWLL